MPRQQFPTRFRTFYPELPVFVRRPFVANGRHYDVDDPFPWRQLAVAQRRVRQLFDAGKLCHSPEDLNDDEKVEEAEIKQAEPDFSYRPDPAPSPTRYSYKDLDEMKITPLRQLAGRMGLPSKRSREDQIQAILDQQDMNNGVDI